jgi:hypothetical protein
VKTHKQESFQESEHEDNLRKNYVENMHKRAERWHVQSPAQHK